MPTLNYTTAKIPGGTIAVVVTNGLVVASSYRGIDDIRSRLLPEFTYKKSDLPVLKDVLERYCGGELTALDEVEVSQPGGPFQLEVWSAMRTIEPGTMG